MGNRAPSPFQSPPKSLSPILNSSIFPRKRFPVVKLSKRRYFLSRNIIFLHAQAMGGAAGGLFMLRLKYDFSKKTNKLLLGGVQSASIIKVRKASSEKKVGPPAPPLP